jgi:predicted Zn-dependent peptidase
MLIKNTLENGLRVVCEKIDYVRSVTIGIWVRTGSRYENDDNNGVSHFIEHMLFKGTNKRTAKEIAENIDCIGGQINAFTGKEYTCYYTKTLDSHMNEAFDVLADMLLNSKFSVDDIEVEKKVVKEEINMYEDAPEELVSDLLHKTVWKNDSLGYPILGTSETLEKITREKIIDYKNQNYNPKNIVIAAVGNLDTEKFIDLVNEYFKVIKSNEFLEDNYKKSEFNGGLFVKNKDTEQTHMCIGFKGVEHGDEKLYSLSALNNIFGGGMSSRLFQKIREEMGLVYSIFSYPSSYIKTGIYTIYAAMNADFTEKVIELIKVEIENLIKNGITSQELNKAKEQLKGNYILGLESTGSRMHSIGKTEIILNKDHDIDKILNYIDKIKIEEIEEVLKMVFNFDNIGLTLVGKIKEEKNYQKSYELLKN